MGTTTNRRAPTAVRRPPTTTAHLHKVLHALDEHLVEGRPLLDVDIRDGRVSIEAAPADFDAYLTALARFGLGEPTMERGAAANGALFVNAPRAAYGEIDGARLRVWTLAQVPFAEYDKAFPPRRPVPGSSWRPST